MLNKKQYLALAQFRHALSGFLAFSEKITRDLGVTSQQYQALLAIKANPSHNILVRDLARHMHLKHNAAVQLVDRLARAKLIRRTAYAKDRRAVVLRLTALGEQKVAQLANQHFQELRQRQKEFANITRLIRKIDAA